MKPKINTGNFGIFVIDYHDGKLSAAETEELMDFLSMHPELEDDFSSICDIRLMPDSNVTCPCRDLLKKTAVTPVEDIDEDNYELFFFEYTEGSLADDDRKKTEAFVQQNPHLAQELENFAKAVLKPDTAIRFEGKAALKKTIPFTGKSSGRAVYRIWPVAASITALIVAGFTLYSMLATPGSQLAISPGMHRLMKETKKPSHTGGTQQDTLPPSVNDTPLFADVSDTLIHQSEKEPERDIIEKTAVLAKHLLPEIIPGNVLQGEAERNDFYSVYQYQIIVAERRTAKAGKEKESGLAGFGKAQIKRIAGSSDENPGTTEKIGFWDIAGLGVAAYNTLTGNDVSLTYNKDKDGRLKDFALGDLVGYGKTKK